MLFNYFSVTSTNIEVIALNIKLVLLVTTVLLWMFVFFSLSYPHGTKISKNKLIFISAFACVTALTSFLPSTVAKVTVNEGNISPTFGSTYAFYAAFLLFSFIYSLYTLVKKYRSTIGIDRVRIQYLFFGFFFALFIPIVTNFLVVIILDSSALVVFGPLAILILDAFIVYSILKHRFLGIRLVIGKFIYFSYLIGIVYAGLYTIIVLESKFIDSPLSTAAILLNIPLVGLGILFYELSSEVVRNILNSKIISVNFDPNVERSNFSDEVSRILDVNKLGKLFINKFHRFYDPSRSSIFLIGKSNSTLFFHEGDYNSEISSLIIENFHLFSSNVIYIKEYIQHIDKLPESIQQIVKILESQKVEILVIFSGKEDFLGYFFSSGKGNRDPYLLNDVAFISRLVVDFSVALERAFLYLEVKNFAETLESKVKEATKTLRRQKKQLQEKYQFEKDMMGIMGHELRTPMTVAKGMAELVLAKAERGNTLDNDYVKMKMEKIYDSIIKEASLIQTMLSTSHIDNNRLNLQITDVDLLTAIEYTVEAYKGDAERKGLVFNWQKPVFDVPIIKSDTGRTQEIINNLVSNAVKYTPKGSVSLTLEKDNEFLYFSVKDTGIGIPKDEIENLGKKFHRIGQHIDEEKQVVRSGGTGLGLYVVKGLLKALGGELIVESEVGKGSTFTATFPLKSAFHDNVFVTDEPVDEHDIFEQMGLSSKDKVPKS